MDYQAVSSNRMYTARAQKYEDSHHPAFASWIVTTQLKPQSGEHILDLACGTGLVTLQAATAVGSSGSVIGIDVSDGMLEVAVQKLGSSGLSNVAFVNHSIANLNDCPALQDKEGCFDAITCVSALVLLAEPWWSLRSWKKYLKPGGRLITDVTHIRNLPNTLAMEMTYHQLGIESPQFRLWAQNERCFRDIVKGAGYDFDSIVFQPSTGAENKVHRVEDVDVVWETLRGQEAARSLFEGNEKRIQKVKTIYTDMWKKLADKDGNIEEIDGVYVMRAYLKQQKSTATPITHASSKPAVTGRCACGAVKWSSRSRPSEINFCHCVACRKSSGGPFLAFATLKTNDVYIFSSSITNAGDPNDLEEESPLKYTWLNVNARRGFCSRCGSTLSMQYMADPSTYAMTLGSIDDESIEGGWKAWDDVRRAHIFIESKAPWYALPDDDGATRMGSMRDLDKYLPM